MPVVHVICTAAATVESRSSEDAEPQRCHECRTSVLVLTSLPLADSTPQDSPAVWDAQPAREADAPLLRDFPAANTTTGEQMKSTNFLFLSHLSKARPLPRNAALLSRQPATHHIILIHPAHCRATPHRWIPRLTLTVPCLAIWPYITFPSPYITILFHSFIRIPPPKLSRRRASRLFIVCAQRPSITCISPLCSLLPSLSASFLLDSHAAAITSSLHSLSSPRSSLSRPATSGKTTHLSPLVGSGRQWISYSRELSMFLKPRSNRRCLVCYR